MPPSSTDLPHSHGVPPKGSDAQLVVALGTDETAAAAFETLMRRYAEQLVAFVMAHHVGRDVAEDTVQELFCRLWTRRRQLHITDEVAGYLYTMARHLTTDYLRAVQRGTPTVSDRQATADAEALTAIPDERGPTVDAAVEMEELRAGIEQAIAHLPERCRLVYVLRWRHRLSNAAIAAALGVSVKAVEMQHARGAKLLRRLLARFLP